MTTVRTIWKFPLDKVGPIEMPWRSEIIHVGLQDDVLCLWAEVDLSNMTPQLRRFTIVGTGQPIPDDWKYLSTWQEPPFVWHLYERFDSWSVQE